MKKTIQRPAIGRMILVFTLVGTCLVGTSWADGEEDVWRQLRSLVGEWKGMSSGFGGDSEVTHEWQFVLGNQFLELRTRSVSQQDDQPRDTHEDIGFITGEADVLRTVCMNTKTGSR
jgi:hypothetical protein